MSNMSLGSKPLDETWTQLPVELVREIFLHAALSDPKVAQNLRLVSRFTNTWVLPTLFRIVHLSNPNQVHRFVNILVPKKSRFLWTKPPDTVVPLTSHIIESLALSLPNQLPSTEVALAKVGQAFCGVVNLALTAQVLIAHIHWMRKHPIRPRHLMLFHFGRPHNVPFYEHIFNEVTHLQTSVLNGHKESLISDLPSLTHLAVYTRTGLNELTIQAVSTALLSVLILCPKLRQLVLCLEGDEDICPSTDVIRWSRHFHRCLQDSRFSVVPRLRSPRDEWQAVAFGAPTVWELADKWLNSPKAFVDQGAYRLFPVLLAAQKEVNEAKNSGVRSGWHKIDWEMDLIQCKNYKDTPIDPGQEGESMFF